MEVKLSSGDWYSTEVMMIQREKRTILVALQTIFVGKPSVGKVD